MLLPTLNSANRLLQPRVVFLQLCQSPHLVRFQANIVRVPAVECLFDDSTSRISLGV
jgi:hypothetical protein